jgi:excisionase family DNA binding protein
MDRYLTIREVMAVLRVGRSTIWNYIAAGKLVKHQVTPRGKVLIPAASVERLINKTQKEM